MSAWPVVKLTDVCVVNPPRDGVEVDDAVAVSFVPMAAVDEETGFIREKISRPFSEIRKGYTFFRQGDVLFAKITPCMQNGKHAVTRETLGGFGFASTEFHVLRPGPTVMAEWIHHFLRQPALLRTFAEEMTGSVGQQRLPEEILARMAIPLPPLAEQQRIVAALDAQLAAAARARAAVAAQLDAATRLQTAQLEEFFPAANSTPSVPLEELVAAPLRTGLSKPMLPGSPIQCLSLSAVRSGALDLNACKPVDVTPEEAAASQIKPGAFYVVRGNGNRSLVGRGGLAPAAPAGMTFPDLLFEVVPDVARLLPDFLRWAWDSPGVRRQIEDKAQTSAGIYKINQGNLRGIRLPLPSLDEQARLVRELQVRDAVTQRLVAGLRARLSALDALPARLLARAFTAPHGQGQNTEEAQLAVLR